MKKKLTNIHPGEILFEEFLKPMKLTEYRLALETEIPQTRISQIIKGKRRMTHDEALKELIKINKIENKIKIIKSISDNGLFEIK